MFFQRFLGTSVNKRFVLLLMVLVLVCAGACFAQDKQRQLDELRKTIERMQEELSAFEKNETATLEFLRGLDKEIDLSSRLAGQLRKQEAEKRKEVDSLAAGLRRTEAELGRLNDLAGRRAVFFYKFGRIQDIEMLLTSRSINQVLLWAEYQRRMRNNDDRLLAGIKTKHEQIRGQQSKLVAELEKQKRLLDEKLKQDEALKKRRKQRQDVLKKIRKDKTYYQAQLAEKRQAAEAIAKLITADIEAQAQAQARPDFSPIPSDGSFTSLKGRLLWPVEGKVVSPYGAFRHPVLNTVTTNLGIDIAATPGAPVRTVASGRVMTVTWQRGYGNVIIITHADGFYTVYTRLGDILVALNDEVAAGQTIGTVAEGTADQTASVQFQIWRRLQSKRSQDLNPTEWLE